MRIKEESNGDLSFTLTKSESLVFFDWLGRYNSKDEYDGFEHPSEQQLLFNFEACLESELAEPFKSDYCQIVDLARNKVFPQD